MKTGKCALSMKHAGHYLNKGHCWTMGTEARLKWVEECNEGKKGKTMYNLVKEIDGSLGEKRNQDLKKFLTQKD